MTAASIQDRGISPVKSVLYLSGVWTTIILAVAVAALYPSWLTLAPAFIFVAGRQHALLIIEHECWHWNMFERRWANNLARIIHDAA